MRRGLLCVGIGLAVSIAIASCGGKVTVDAPASGAVGVGGAVGTVGPVDAVGVGGFASSVGFGGAVNDGTTTSFVGSGPVGFAATTTAATTSTGETSPCTQCANAASAAQCSSAVQACFVSTECAAILQCHLSCGFSADCLSCDESHPMGRTAYANAIECAVCKSCAMECKGQSIHNLYCPQPL